MMCIPIFEFVTHQRISFATIGKCRLFQSLNIRMLLSQIRFFSEQQRFPVCDNIAHTRAVLEQHKEPCGKTIEILMLLLASSHCIAPGFLQVQCPPVDQRQCNPCQTLQHLQNSNCSVSDWGAEEEQECCSGDCAIKATHQMDHNISPVQILFKKISRG